MDEGITKQDLTVWKTELGFPVESLPEELVAHSHENNLTRMQRVQIEAIAKLRGLGMSVRAVADVLGVGTKTVMAVERYHPALVTTYKERMASLCEGVAGRIVESLLEDVESGRMKPGEKGLAAGILLTKAGELRGQAPSENRHEVKISVEDLGAWQRQIKAQLQEQVVIDVESSDSKSGGGGVKG
jgi:hypothetical protein